MVLGLIWIVHNDCVTALSTIIILRECDNPRPWKNNRIIRHGLIKCKTCLGLWNRDTNASRNILHIVKNEIMRKGRPEYLRRTKSSISGTTSVSD